MPDVLEALEAQRRAAARGPLPADAMALAAHRQVQGLVVMRMEHLLAADEWQTFVAHVQALQTRAQEVLDAHLDQIEAGDLVGDELARAALRVRVLHERCAVYEEILALPDTLVRQGKQSLDTSPLGGVDNK